MELHTKYGRRFTRARKEQEKEPREAGAAGSARRAREQIEQRLCLAEERVDKLFQKPNAGKRRWDATSAKEQAQKWCKLQEGRARTRTVGPQEKGLNEKGSSGAAAIADKGEGKAETGNR